MTKLINLSRFRAEQIARAIVTLEQAENKARLAEIRVETAKMAYERHVPESFRVAAPHMPTEWFPKFSIGLKIEQADGKDTYEYCGSNDYVMPANMSGSWHPLNRQEHPELYDLALEAAGLLAASKEAYRERLPELQRIILASRTTKRLLEDMPMVMSVMPEGFFYDEPPVQLPTTSAATELNAKLKELVAA